MSSAPTYTKQLDEIVALYHATDTTDPPQRQALADRINQSILPRYHKEVLLAAFLAKTGEEVTLGLHLLRQQEFMRHADALNRIEQRALNERLKRHYG